MECFMKWLLSSFFLSTLAIAELKVVRSSFIFDKAPFDSCHAATLTETQSGKIICAWFAGSEEGAKDVTIWQSILEKGAWTKPKKIAEEVGVPCWNPVLFTTPLKNEVLLFYKVGQHPQVWSGCLKRSSDEGKSWGAKEDLPAGVIGPVKNKPLLINNRLVCGSSIESYKRWGCWMDITKDFGREWTKSTPINMKDQLFGIIQPTLFVTGDGRVKMLARSHQIGKICSSQSFDGGETWEAAKPTSLPNPNSGIDAVKLQNGDVLLVYNNSDKERYPLNVALSSDDGDTWNMILTLEDKKNEYSYPAVIQSKDGLIHIVYTADRTHIRYVVLQNVLSSPKEQEGKLAPIT